jgi:hypothetical protein
MYATWSNHGIYLNATNYSGYYSYDSSRSRLGEPATGSTEGAELSTFISGGVRNYDGPENYDSNPVTGGCRITF